MATIKPTVKPTVISTFAGCGGSSLGYHMAGFRELLAVEWDDNAAATFRLNFPTVPIYHGDIAKLTGKECQRLAGGLRVGELDVFDGSPPCQGFSTSGLRRFDDPRNSLFREYARLIADLQPKVFVMENVTGMIKGYMKQAYLTIIQTLRDCGYRAQGEIMNAMYYGVPQNRERVIIIGVRKGLNVEPSHPKPQTKPLTIYDVLPPPFGVGKPFPPQDHPQTPRLCPKLRLLVKRIKPGQCQADHDQGKGFQNLVRPFLRKPSPTITKLNPGNGRATLLHPIEHRSISIGEVLRLGSFPDDFKMIGTFAERWARVGNSVPPLLMKAIATHVKAKILTLTE